VDEHYDPNMLPEPQSHVMLNHLYAQSVKDNVLVMACTTRYKFCSNFVSSEKFREVLLKF
jgi:hypothetical protein